MQEIPLANQVPAVASAAIPVPTAKSPTTFTLHFLNALPFLLMHLMCLGVFFVGFSWTALAVAVFMYGLRMFAITGFYHRYFSHKAFKTSRFCQFLFGVLGCSAVQRGPLWWAANHRHHHAHSDQPEDIHSPIQHGVLWSHTLWFLSDEAASTNMKLVPDLAKYPELRFLDKFEKFVGLMVGTSMFFLGVLLQRIWPTLGTDGWQMLIWGFFVSTMFTWHGTYLVNSLTHIFGRRPYKTRDDSRNSFVIAILTFGEGWHNNHHAHPTSAAHGLAWYELDLTYLHIRALQVLGLATNVQRVSVDDEPAEEAA